MKILIVNDDFLPEKVFGAGMVAFNLARALKNGGHQVKVYSSIQDKSKPGLINYEGLPVYRVFSNYKKHWQAYITLYNPKIIHEFKKILTEFKPQVVHFHNIHTYLCYDLFKIAKKSGAKTFLTAHDVMLFHYSKLVEFIDPKNLSLPEKFDYKVGFWSQVKRFKKRYNPFRNLIIRYYLKYIDKIFAVSYALKEALNQNKIKNVEVIHNGINVSEWEIDANEIDNFKNQYNLKNKKVIFFAGLSAIKGGYKIIECLKIVKQKNSEIALLVVGEKDNGNQKILKAADQEKIPVVLTGWIKDKILKAAYGASDIVMVPSICFDSFPTVNLEALASKKPVIATCFGGSSELIVDGQNGFIVNPFDIQNLAAKACLLLENESLAQEFGQNGYLRVKEEFSLDKQVSKILKFYEL